MRRVRALLLVAGAALVLGSCTFVPTDSQPQVIPRHSVPFELLNKKPVATPPVTTTPSR